jgi:hypothetical protein
MDTHHATLNKHTFRRQSSWPVLYILTARPSIGASTFTYPTKQGQVSEAESRSTGLQIPLLLGLRRQKFH